MPVVPFAHPNPKSPSTPQPDPTMFAIAAADLHDAGMLFEAPINLENTMPIKPLEDK